MKFEWIGERWICYPEQWRNHRFTRTELNDLARGETVNVRFEQDEYPVGVHLLPGEIRGVPCLIAASDRENWYLRRWTGEGGPLDVPLHRNGYADLQPEQLKNLFAGGTCDLVRPRGTVRVFLQWREYNGNIHTFIRKWDETAFAASEETRRAFLDQVDHWLRIVHKGEEACVLTLIPSKLAPYFEHGCDRRMIRYRRPNRDGSEGVRSFSSDAGNNWEDKVVDWLKRHFGDAPERTAGASAGLMELFGDPEQAGKLENPGDVLFLSQPTMMLPGRTAWLLPLVGETVWPIPPGAYWGKVRPDLLLCTMGEDGVVALTVIDVKLAKTPHVSHVMQVSLYLSVLQTYLQSKCEPAEGEPGVWVRDGLRLRVNMDTAYLWNGGDALVSKVYGDEELTLDELRDLWSSFRPKDAQPFLESFFLEDLPRIRASLPDTPEEIDKEVLHDAAFCMGSFCASCQWQKECLAWGREDHSVQLLPDLKIGAQRYLLEYLRNTLEEGLDRRERARLLRERTRAEAVADELDQQGGLYNALGMNSVWRTHRFKRTYIPMAENAVQETDSNRIRAFARQLEEGEHPMLRRAKNTRSLQIPRRQDVAVMLTMHSGMNQRGESVVYAWGIDVRCEKTVNGLPAGPLTEVSPELGENELEAHFLENLNGILQAVDAYNRNGGTLTLQAYVLNEEEFESIKALLFRQLDETQYRDMAQTVLFWLMGSGLAGLAADRMETHPEAVTQHPVAILKKELTDVFTFPGVVEIGLREMARAFGLEAEDRWREFLTRDCADLFKDLSDDLRTEKAFAPAPPGCPVRRTDVDLARFLTTKLALQHELLRRVQNGTYAEHYLAKKPEHGFALTACNGMDDPDLSKLLFRTVNEEYLIREEGEAVWRDESWAVARGKLMKLDRRNAEVEGTTMTWNRAYRSRFDNPALGVGYRSPIEMKYELSFPFTRGRGTIRVTFSPANEQEERKFRNLRTLSLYNEADTRLMDREKSTIRAAAHMPVREYLRLEDPEPHPILVKDGAAPGAELGVLADETAFLDSQRETYTYAVSHRFTLLQGPPGTGKTDFIARTIAAVSRAFLEEGYDRPEDDPTQGSSTFRILISANANKAIENAVEKTEEKRQQLPPAIRDRLIVKKYEATDKPWMGSKDYAEAQDGQRRVTVIGATCWSCYKNTPELGDHVGDGYWWTDPARFDLIIIDEATQVSVVQAMMIMGLGHARTHFLIVGDQHQLSTIMKGNYVPLDEQHNLFSSVFELYLDTCRRLGCKKTLQEHFRMNEAISHYSAWSIYDSKAPENIRFTGANEDIRTQRLALRDGWEEGLTELERFVMDPDHALVLITLRGGSQESLKDKELELAARFAFLLQTLTRESIRDEVGNVTRSQVQDYWGKDKRLGIVSPTNAHSSSLLERVLQDTQDWMREQVPDAEELKRGDFLVDTVDKLQGQERDAVIISYGESDPDRATQLKEFFYDYRRLNVSITRARMKAIIIFTGALTDRPIELLSSDDQKLLKGLSFLCGMEDVLKDPDFVAETRPEGRFFTNVRSQRDGQIKIQLYGHGYRKNEA